MKTAVRVLILVFLSMVILAACGGQEPEIFDIDFTFKSDKVDLEGVTIKYMRPVDGQASYTIGDQVLGYEVDTILGDLAAKRIKDVQKELNCVLEIEYYSGDTPYTNFRMYNTVGTYYCDIFCGISDRFREDMKIGSLVGLSQIEEFLDFRNEEKWGRRNDLEVLYWEDDVYGLIPMSWPTSSVTYQGLNVVSEDAVAAVGAADPRDLYENGQWTWETFRDCLEQYFVQEGSEVKQYAVTPSYVGDLGSAYLLSNGYKLVEKGLDGQYHSGLRNPCALTAMNEAWDITYGPLSYTIDFNSDPIDPLINGTTVIGILHQSEYLTDRIVKKMNNFGIVPWPSGPDVDPGYIGCNYMNLERAIVISRFSPNLEATAIALNALYEPFEEYPTFESRTEFLYHTYFFDIRDAEIYLGMFLNAQYSCFASPTWNTLHEWLEGRRTPTEYIESSLEKIETHIEEEMAPSKRGIEAIWGEE